MSYSHVTLLKAQSTCRPRWKGSVSKDTAALVRPRMTFTAVLAHGWCCSLYCAPEWVSSGACYCIELLCRTIQQVFLKCILVFRIIGFRSKGFRSYDIRHDQNILCIIQEIRCRCWESQKQTHKSENISRQRKHFEIKWEAIGSTNPQDMNPIS